ncbi:MAG: DNA cytosine methyltransferase [Clostridiales bacterium]|nr:DNA cytosine methyltransferase [Clostridiales bacterium]MBD9159617.1 DNA cytosine methyltransferase [Clostridiales bacterium]
MDFYTIKQIAEKSGKSQKTIRRHIAAKKLKADKIQNKYRISDEAYKEWINGTVFKEDDKGVFTKKISTETNDSYKINWADISKSWEKDGWKNVNDRNGYKFVDLFSGAGGLSCGLVMAGFTPVASVEIMPEAVETYQYNFIDKKGFNEKVETRDIRTQEVKEELYKTIGNQHIDLIVGGFPCQGFSMSGNRVVSDPRNSLYLEMLEIVKNVQPDYVVMENVEGLRSMLDGKVETQILNDYKEIGYEINVTTLNAADYGVAQQRKRVIFIGNRIGNKNYHPKPLYEPNNYKTLGSAIYKYMNIAEDKSINHVFTRHTEDMKKRLANVPEGSSLFKNYSDSWKKSPWDKPSCTIKENHGAVNIHPKLPRVLTAREIAAIQSFPDDFIFQGAKKWQLVQIGNAVPPLLGKAIGLSIEKGLNEKK